MLATEHGRPEACPDCLAEMERRKRGSSTAGAGTKHESFFRRARYRWCRAQHHSERWAEAYRANEATFKGAVCLDCPELDGQRNTATGGCVQCSLAFPRHPDTWSGAPVVPPFPVPAGEAAESVARAR